MSVSVCGWVSLYLYLSLTFFLPFILSVCLSLSLSVSVCHCLSLPLSYYSIHRCLRAYIIHYSFYVSFFTFVCLCVYTMHVCKPNCLSFRLYFRLCLPVVCLSVCMHVCKHFIRQFLCMYIHSVCISVSLIMSVCVSVCVSVCLTHCLPIRKFVSNDGFLYKKVLCFISILSASGAHASASLRAGASSGFREGGRYGGRKRWLDGFGMAFTSKALNFSN